MKNLGVEFGNSLKFDKHISSMIGSSFFHLCLLAKIKPVLSEILQTLQTLKERHL